MIAGRKIIGGGCSGGMKEAQEMVDFAAQHNIIPEIEVILMDYVNNHHGQPCQERCQMRIFH
ncbi:hypothetical protein CRYUN_Cryun24cG0044500 [Craigia yunnanensis]